jgi:hypothetical protein
LAFSFRHFAQEIDLSGLEVDMALRKFQSYFRMPVSGAWFISNLTSKGSTICPYGSESSCLGFTSNFKLFGWNIR